MVCSRVLSPGPIHRCLSRTLVLGAAIAATLSLGACKTKGGETETPGDSGTTPEDLDKKIKAAQRDAKVASLIDLANADLQNGRYVSATRLAENALADDANNADAYAVLGAARWRAGDFVGSTDAFEEALSLDANNYGATLRLARNYQALGRDPDAIAILDRVLKDDPKQVEPYVAKLWSHYAMLDADAAVADADNIFTHGIKDDDPLIPLIQAYAAYMRPLAGKGPLSAAKGKGSTSLGVNDATGYKFAGGVVGGGFTQVVLAEFLEENVVDPAFAEAAGLKPVGKFKPILGDAEADIVIVPEIKFGEFVLTNVPAYVTPLSDLTEAIGEDVGIRLGRQSLLKIGAVRYDYPGMSVEFDAAPPAGAPDGAVETPLLMVSWHLRHAPVVPIKIKGSEHPVNAYWGGLHVSCVAFSKKHYLKSGFLPRTVENPEDEAGGRKMVYIEGFSIGDQDFEGCGGLVLVNDPPDPTIREFVNNAAFEIGGFVNLNLIKSWKVTVALSSGKLFIER